MLNFLDYKKVIEEKLVTFGDKVYPKFGQVVILAGGAGCFDGETLVHTEKGHVPISEVKVGDLVWTFSEETEERMLCEVQVLKVFDEHPDRILKLTFENGEVVVCTENHEFYVDGEWVPAKDL